MLISKIVKFLRTKINESAAPLFWTNRKIDTYGSIFYGQNLKIIGPCSTRISKIKSSFIGGILNIVEHIWERNKIVKGNENLSLERRNGRGTKDESFCTQMIKLLTFFAGMPK